VISVIARWSIVRGRQAEAREALRRLAVEVYEREPFVLMYTIHVPDLEVTSYPTPPELAVMFFSVFSSHGGFLTHLRSQLFRDWMDAYQHLFLVKNGDLFVTSEFLSRQAGFVRPEMVAAVDAARRGEP
jgi:quinol monooxygenase YgiN